MAVSEREGIDWRLYGKDWSEQNYLNIKESLKCCGKNVTIYPLCKIAKAEVIEIGDHSTIDDFVFIYGGKGIKIGRYVHICTGTKVIGGGELIIGDYSAITQNAVIVTGTDTFKNGARMSACLPQEQRNPLIGKVELSKDSFIGAGSVIMPNVFLGEGAVVGAGSFVPKNTKLEPWMVYLGSPVKEVCERPKVTMEDI